MDTLKLANFKFPEQEKADNLWVNDQLEDLKF